MVDEQPDGAAVATVEQEELMTLSETIEFLGISKQTLYRMMERGEVKGVRVGRQWRFRKAELSAYLERGPVAMAMAAAPHDALDAELDYFAERLETPRPAIDDAGDPGEQKVILLATQIIALAIDAKASDIHLEPAKFEQDPVLLLRYRVDGVLHEVRRIPTNVTAALTARFKTMADMNIDERRVPQDGRIHLRNHGRDYDVRINTAPGALGEAITMRILDQHSLLLGLDKLGFVADDLARLQEWIHRPNGLILATGPTGSGKTTTLYSCLLKKASERIKTMTVEDPVEVLLPWITQVPVNRKAGVTFPVALRGFLRSDPDIIMVGEIRDLETAEIIIQASLTGHLLLSTLHTQDCPAVLSRLTDMGVAPFLVGSTLIGVVSQRLIRVLCPHCKQPTELSPQVREQVRQQALSGGYQLPDDAQFYRAVGCEQCNGRGYRGRTALFELMEFTTEVKDAFLRGASEKEIAAIAVLDGMVTLAADGIRKAALGVSTIEEVLRVAQTR